MLVPLLLILLFILLLGGGFFVSHLIFIAFAIVLVLVLFNVSRL